MPGPDWFPIISQAKFSFQVLCGDWKGAARTSENFFNECPGFSQLTSAIKLAVGDTEGAVDTQIRCFKNLNNVINATPVIGHFKALVQHMEGDHEGGNKALNAANRTAVIMGTAAAAGALTGGIASIPAGIAAGLEYDLVATLVTGKTQGYAAAVENISKKPSAGAFFDIGYMGYSDGKNGAKGHDRCQNASD